ncbi:hypothetical protein ACJVC5_19290 [Peredibacter sp. HCB2-198]|uniref:hypothetical protein n=1 Tax=Peredibacter sp. HCB2-198 TaxID=3383025 RepID=UPI0038B61766
MATTMHPGSHHLVAPRSLTQKVCIGVGLAFVAAGLLGIVFPGFMAMHLSLAHNIIHLASGALALWCGYADDPKKAYSFAFGFGVVYGILGLAGFLIGEPGYPGVGHMEADENLMRVIPNVLEFGTADHIVHIAIAAVLILSAYSWIKRRDVDNGTSGIIKTQARVDRDLNRRSDSERRV